MTVAFRQRGEVSQVTSRELGLEVQEHRAALHHCTTISGFTPVLLSFRTFIVKYQVLIVSSALLIAACVSTETHPYPGHWPPTTEASSCMLISGQYTNEASETTLWRSPKNSKTARSYLTSLLIQGDSGSFDDEQSKVSSIAIDGENLNATRKFQDGSQAAVESNGRWSCEASGHVAIRFDGLTQAEGTVVLKSVFDVLLHKAKDGSLVVKATFYSRGLDGGVVPSKYTRVDWMRFAALSDSAPRSEAVTRSNVPLIT